MAIRLNTFKYFSTLSPIEFHNLCDDFTSNSANSIGDGSSLTPQACRNLLALAPKLIYEKKSFKLKIKQIKKIKKKVLYFNLKKKCLKYI